jgi:hypothetical protein
VEVVRITVFCTQKVQLVPAFGNTRYGGEGGIRTPDTLSGMAAFEAARFNRSRTSPRRFLAKSLNWNGLQTARL